MFQRGSINSAGQSKKFFIFSDEHFFPIYIRNFKNGSRETQNNVTKIEKFIVLLDPSIFKLGFKVREGMHE